MPAATHRIVTIGGGSGQFTLLNGLRPLPGLHLTAVVSMVDSGGSTGRLRDELGILPPGDILKCILALSPRADLARSIFLKRFRAHRRLRGHNAGNMLLTMLGQYTGSFPAGIRALCEILDVRGTILPVTVDRATLVAELTDGTRIFGEAAIDLPRGARREKIRDVYLVPHHQDAITAYPPVLEAIARADTIVIGPGDLYTSIFPNLIVPGVSQALQQASGRLVYNVNIMNKYAETHQFTAIDFVAALEARIGRPIDVVVHNTRRPPPRILARYRRHQSEFVTLDPLAPFWRSRRLLGDDLLNTSGGVVRHDERKLAALIAGLIKGESTP
ncbi:MAG TPA: uridine diphosphate-N-acetylglucosamine-binding protein YvcK [Desulfobacteraceae bacterium]|nr:uridine diphosphate-N-acetylglucosamine-binding protein YvcK [Deltaproteobacteria bacterium]MBW2355889.1 uridine diphosphate-N-acetylglucosamine-binding protein YvcK [Deltaproteobacteria bacterium]HDI59595.1 uridine diphosphate-N-acetylglucosamine-binding protein YvcK [Desulfobacteraceae bacterium]